MALKKQSIRKHHHIRANNITISKEELITMSELWTESQENLFRKMLKQGGKFRINNVLFNIAIEMNPRKRSDGTADKGVIQIPGDTRF